MLIYTSVLRTSTLVVRVTLTILSGLLFLIGLLAAIGLMQSKDAELTYMIFTIVVLTVAYFIFRVSGWNIRQYLIYDDKLVVNIFWGVKKLYYQKAQLKAFNDLKVLVLNENGGIGIVTERNKIIRILELEVDQFPVFIDRLQTLVRWDLSLKYDRTMVVEQ